MTRRTRTVLVASAALLTLLGSPAAAAPACDRGCAVAAVDGYVRALVTHDAAAVALHPRATRVEAGLPTGFSGEQIRRDLEHGPQYRLIRGVRDVRYAVEGATVTADFVLDVGPPGLAVTTAAVHETFVLDRGLIRTIVADVAIGAR